jgi:ATP-dependent exoDNAse (exonuclease V) alpha subunit
MVRADLFDMIFWTLLFNDVDFNNIHFILSGDMGQLSAVLKPDEKPYFKYSKNDFRVSDYYPLLDFKEIELDVIKRQSNPEFIEALNKVRNKEYTDYFKQFEGLPEKGIYIAATNRLVNQRNQDELDKLDGDTIIYEGEVSQNFNPKDFVVDKIITLKEGCKVMYLKNCQSTKLVNGDIGILQTKIVNNKIVPYFVSDRLKIWVGLAPHKFETKEYKLVKGFPTLVTKSYIEQLPIKLCYSLSIHKVQGQSFDQLTLDKTDHLFDPNMLYVALSRVRSPEGLSIIPKN